MRLIWSIKGLCSLSMVYNDILLGAYLFPNDSQVSYEFRRLQRAYT